MIRTPDLDRQDAEKKQHRDLETAIFGIFVASGRQFLCSCYLTC